MCNENYAEEQSSEQEMMEMFAEYSYYNSKHGFSDWIYQNQQVGNGKQLVEALESTELQEQYLKAVGLPLDSELE